MRFQLSQPPRLHGPAERCQDEQCQRARALSGTQAYIVSSWPLCTRVVNERLTSATWGVAYNYKLQPIRWAVIAYERAHKCQHPALRCRTTPSRYMVLGRGLGGHAKCHTICLL